VECDQCVTVRRSKVDFGHAECSTGVVPLPQRRKRIHRVARRNFYCHPLREVGRNVLRKSANAILRSGSIREAVIELRSTGAHPRCDAVPSLDKNQLGTSCGTLTEIAHPDRVEFLDDNQQAPMLALWRRGH
jgi:hypothetical protein